MDENFELKVKALLKVREEIYKAVDYYLQTNYRMEAYHMFRAATIAEALGITADEFYMHKRLIESETEMLDSLIDGFDIISYLKDEL